MTDLTPETLASLRAINRTHGLHPDQIDALLDALAAEKAAREEWEATANRYAAKFEAEYERAVDAVARLEGVRADYDEMRPIWIKRCEDAEARAVKAEQERNKLEARLFASQAAYDDLARETGVALDTAWTAKNAAEARVAELEAGITALAEEWERDWLALSEAEHAANDGERRWKVITVGARMGAARRLRALTEKTDPTKED